MTRDLLMQFDRFVDLLESPVYARASLLLSASLLSFPPLVSLPPSPAPRNITGVCLLLVSSRLPEMVAPGREGGGGGVGGATHDATSHYIVAAGLSVASFALQRGKGQHGDRTHSPCTPTFLKRTKRPSREQEVIVRSMPRKLAPCAFLSLADMRINLLEPDTFPFLHKVSFTPGVSHIVVREVIDRTFVCDVGFH